MKGKLLYIFLGLLAVLGGVYVVNDLVFSHDAVAPRVVNVPDVVEDQQETVRSSVDNEYAKISELFNQQDYEQVIRSSKKFLQEYPKNHFSSNVLFKIAESYYRLENFPEARNGYNSVIRNFPGSQMAKFAEIKLDLLGKIAGRSTMDSFLKLETPESGYQECRDLYKGRDFDKAIKGFEAFLRKYPNSDLAPNAQYWLAECYYGKDDLRRAKREFERVIENYPNSAKVPSANRKILMSGQKLLRNDVDAKLEQVYKNLYKKYEQKKYKDAISGFKEFIEKYPDSKLVPNAYYWIAESYYAAANYQDGVYKNTLLNFKLAQDNFKIVINKYPENQKAIDARTKLGKIERIVYYVKARQAYMRKDYDYAIKNFREFVNRYPTDILAANCFYWAGECYFEQEQYDEALAEFEKVRSEYPKHHKAKDALLKINEIKKIRVESSPSVQMEEGLTDFQRLEEYYKNKDYDNLITEGKKFFRNNPNDKDASKAIFLIGEGYYKQKDFEMAKLYYKKILDENRLPGEREIVQNRYDKCLEKSEETSELPQPAKEVDVSETTNVSSDKARLDEGIRLCEVGQWSEGYNVLNLLKGKFANNSEEEAILFTWIGQYYCNSRDYTKAKIYFNRVNAGILNLKDKEVYYAYFVLSCYRLREYDFTLQLIAQFMQEFNENSRHYKSLENLRLSIENRQGN